jgi:hypothetical protein
MASQSVQFYGTDKVLQAYTARGIETWGLFDKKQFINAGESADDLKAFLAMLEPGGSQGVYTLKVYRDVEDLDTLTDRTECNGSFNFKLFKQMESASLPAAVGNARYSSQFDPVMNKMQGIINEEVSNAIDKRLNGTRDEEPENKWNDVIMGYVNDPEKLVSVINAIRGFVVPGAAAAVSMPYALGGTEPARRVGAIPSNNEEKLQRLAVVLDRLEKADPNILDVLEKIADLAENDPAKYKMAKGFL